MIAQLREIALQDSMRRMEALLALQYLTKLNMVSKDELEWLHGYLFYPEVTWIGVHIAVATEILLAAGYDVLPLLESYLYNDWLTDEQRRYLLDWMQSKQRMLNVGVEVTIHPRPPVTSD